MRWTTDTCPRTGLEVVSKHAESDAEELRLTHEARMLRTSSHPGVVELVGVATGGDSRVVLHLRFVECGDLSARERLPADEVAGVGAAIATTLADLHDIGVIHANIDASHILLDPQGRPVVCGFGSAYQVNSTEDRRAHAGRDVTALGATLIELLPADAPSALVRVLRHAARTRGRPMGARQLARSLVDRVEGARLPSATPLGGSAPMAPGVGVEGRPDVDAGMSVSEDDATSNHPMAATTTTGTTATNETAATAGVPTSSAVATTGIVVPRGGASPQSAGVAHPPPQVLAAALILVALVVSVSALVWISHRRSSSAMAHSPCPAVDDGCLPLRLDSGVVVSAAGSFHLGQPGDVVVLGRWRCSALSLPAVLRPRTGEVWVFSRWPGPDVGVPGRLVGRFSTAQSLRVVPTSSRCDELEVVRNAAPARLINLEDP